MNAMLADGWVVTDPEGILSFDLVTSPTLTGKALEVTITGEPSSFPYSASILKQVEVEAGGTYYHSFSVFPDDSGFEWRRDFSDPGSPVLPTLTWTEILAGPAVDSNGDGLLTAGVGITLNTGGYAVPAVFLADRLRYVTPACIDGTPDDGTTPDDEPPNTSGLLFVDSFEETA
jgi:hypothetical protein